MQDPTNLDKPITDPKSAGPYTDASPADNDRDVITEELSDDPTELLQVPADELASELDGLAVDETE